ncbi:MAG: serine/threonine-protein kinase, partial [Acidobacteria bacterium]|nr:serine/threonine-protein kinase [Acidobacteriota bacterium]
MISELIGHYRVVASLGSGGMGVVWKAIDTRLNRPVALKAIRDADATNTDAILRLRAEALAAASLDHPYICKIYELLETGSATLVVMEFVEGENLGDILARRTPPLVDTLRWGSEIAEGLANAHARGIVHRDVKPTNVMVTAHNHIKLLDFGIARITGDAALTQSGLTLPGNTPGTPQYMAPEQALGKVVDGRADIFSLGVLLFRCLAGQLPFEGTTRDAYVQQMLSGTIRPLDQLAPATPGPVRDIVKACLERDPARRPETAMVVAETLRRAGDMLSTGTIPVVHAPSPAIPRWAMQTALLLIAAAAAVFALWRWTSSPVEDTAPRALVPAVTWPTAESEALISPDGKWLSFISDKQNQRRIFIQAIEGGDAVPVAIPGAVVSHAWSSDGRELAVVVRQASGHFLMVVPAFFGGSPRSSLALDPTFEDPLLVRWTAEGVYMDVNRGQAGRSLIHAALDAGTLKDVSARWPKPIRYRSIDVSTTGAVVMDAAIDGNSDLWTSNVDGTNLQA